MAGSWRADVQALVAARGAALRRTAYLLTLDVHEADDLVQSALVRTFGAATFPRDLPGQERYVRRVMANLAIDRHRRRSREVVGVAVDVVVAAPDPVEALDVRDALRGLSARQRTCVVLRYYEQKSSAEIAAELSISPGAVRRYLHDGLQAMKVVLDEREERTR